MSSHFSILSIVSKPEIGEHIAIGILLVAKGDVFLKISKRKMNIAKKLVDEPVFSYIQDCLLDLRKDVGSLSGLRENESLFNEQVFASGKYSSGYLEYMGRYSNNVLAFSSPKQIDKDADNELLDILYRKYIDANSVESKSETQLFGRLNRDFYPRVRSHFNVEQRITENEVPKLLVPVKLDLIGHNDRPVFAQKIDLERRMDFIQNDFGTVSMISDVLVNPQGFIISAEPNKAKYPEQHDVWIRLRQRNSTEYVDISEVERIKEYAELHDVQPFLKS